MLLGIPWWVLVVLAFICFSGYMSFRAMRAESILEKQYIEDQGKVYMERMHREREKRQQLN